MKREYRFFRLDGGVLRPVHDAFVEKRRAQLQARADIEREFGATGTFGNERELVGLLFQNPPEGWRPIKGIDEAFKPPLGKAGKA
ncbi:MAG TPA: hypothetical protein VF614_09540, partial [Chthoniobacteraceae bacterium]